ncbi:glycosyltransferase [Candidatus Sumerlaeota bacterium]|nr:glycosyltransferase [Candidatus Sumerlaeota bacterium]
MRIVIFIGTSELTALAHLPLEIAKGARERGHDALIVGEVVSRETPPLTQLGEAADKAGIPFRLLQRRRRLDPGIIGQMEMIFKKFRPDLYQSHDLLGAFLYRAARWRPSHWQGFSRVGPEGSSFARWIEPRLLRLADRVFAGNSDAEAGLKLKGISREKLMALPSGESGDAAIRMILDDAQRLCAR